MPPFPIRPRKREIKYYGWRPDTPDVRDRLFALAPAPEQVLPPLVDLRSQMPPVYNQAALGSCVGQAVVGAIHYLHRDQPDNEPHSRLFVYYEAREIEGTIAIDAGCEIRDAIKAVVALGAPDEHYWPYEIKKFSETPPDPAYQDAKTHLVTAYRRIENFNMVGIKTALAGGLPVVFGFAVYDSFESQQVAKTGQLDLPGPNENMLGGHAVLMVGYDDDVQRVMVRNSWGSEWGMAGYFTMPYSYVTNSDLCADFWAIEKVEG